MVTTFAAMLEAKLMPVLSEVQRKRVKAILTGESPPTFAQAIRTLYYELADENPELATALTRLMVNSFGGEPDLEREEERQRNRARVDVLDEVDAAGGLARYYRLRALGAWTRRDALDACGLPRSELAWFGSFALRADLPRLREARDAVVQWVRGKVPLVTLSGPPGCGKTHLLTAAVRHLVHRAQLVTYMDERRLIDESRRAIRDQRVSEFKHELSEMPRLVLDDLGASSASDYDRAVLDEIIDARWRARKYTLVATNLTSSGLPARLASRLGDTKWGVQVSIAAPDGRRDRWYERGM